jgi:hypothetical protein
MKSGNLNVLEHSGSLHAFKGTALPVNWNPNLDEAPVQPFEVVMEERNCNWNFVDVCDMTGSNTR